MKFHLTFTEWCSTERIVPASDAQRDIGIYIRYADEVWNLVPQAFNNGYVIYDAFKGTWIEETNELEYKPVIYYWNIVIGKTFKIIKERYERERNPF